MATFHDRTTAPRVQGQLLAAGGVPALDRRAIGRDGWARARELAARLGGEIRDHVAEGMRQAWAAARGLLQAAARAPAASDASALASESASTDSAADRPAQSRPVDYPDRIGVVPSYPATSGAAPPLLPLPAPLPSLPAALSRRRAIFGAVAVAAVPAVALPAAASTATTPPVSAEAKALQDELARVSSEYRRACREADEASARVEYPDPPEALYVRPGDTRLFARFPEPSWSDKAGGRHWWADPPTVEKLRGDTFHYLDRRQDAAACARRDEIVAAFDQWALDDTAAEDVAGFTAAQARFDVAFTAYRAFRVRLVELRTEDPEVLTVKGLAVVELLGRDAGRLDALIARAAERESGPNETALALSMARDFIALFGAGVWVAHA